MTATTTEKRSHEDILAQLDREEAELHTAAMLARPLPCAAERVERLLRASAGAKGGAPPLPRRLFGSTAASLEARMLRMAAQAKRREDRGEAPEPDPESDGPTLAAVLRKFCNVGPRYARADLSDVERPRQLLPPAEFDSYVYVRDQLSRLLAKPGTLVLCGPTGPGKTHLLSALVHAFTDAGRPAYFADVMEFYDKHFEREEGSRMLDRLNGKRKPGVRPQRGAFELLGIDEVEVQPANKWHRDRLRNLIDRRYRNEVSTVLLTNLPAEKDERGERVFQQRGPGPGAADREDPAVRVAQPSGAGVVTPLQSMGGRSRVRSAPGGAGEDRMSPLDSIRTEAVDARYTDRFRAGLKQTTRGLIDAARVAAEVNDQYGYGTYVKWLNESFNVSRQTGDSLLRVFRNLIATPNFSVDDVATIAPSALYLLAAPSTPKDVRERFIESAKDGHPVRHRDVRVAVRSATSRRSAGDDDEVDAGAAVGANGNGRPAAGRRFAADPVIAELVRDDDEAVVRWFRAANVIESVMRGLPDRATLGELSTGQRKLLRDRFREFVRQFEEVVSGRGHGAGGGRSRKKRGSF